MSHFAKVENGIVTQVIVAEQDVIDSGLVGTGWVQTSYNTIGNTHVLNGTPLRGNFAGVGYIYDDVNDVFYAPKPYPSWILSAKTFQWEAPSLMPKDGKFYLWDEPTVSWKEMVS